MLLIPYSFVALSLLGNGRDQPHGHCELTRRIFRAQSVLLDIKASDLPQLHRLPAFWRLHTTMQIVMIIQRLTEINVANTSRENRKRSEGFSLTVRLTYWTTYKHELDR